jgi:histidine triad (HIT) family protein
MKCVFCDIVRGAAPAHVVFEDESSLAFLDMRPLFPGHTLLVPRAHIETFQNLPEPLTGSLFRTVQRLSAAVEAACGAEGTFVALNNKVSQSVPHLHIHVVPRRNGDGLKGFFWPRSKYASEEEARATAEAIRAAVLPPQL